MEKHYLIWSVSAITLLSIIAVAWLLIQLWFYLIEIGKQSRAKKNLVLLIFNSSIAFCLAVLNHYVDDPAISTVAQFAAGSASFGAFVAGGLWLYFRNFENQAKLLPKN